MNVEIFEEILELASGKKSSNREQQKLVGFGFRNRMEVEERRQLTKNKNFFKHAIREH